MSNRTLAAWLLATAFAASAPFALAQSQGVPLAPPQQPIAAEKNPPGDIPDNQAFVAYKSPLGFSIKVPEGWARREKPGAVSFSDKYNALQMAVSREPLASTLEISVLPVPGSPSRNSGRCMVSARCTVVASSRSAM